MIGHRGVGKTALLKRLEILFSRREDVMLSDLDFEIENRAGRSIASIFEKDEAEFRRNAGSRSAMSVP
jgi:shikimate kinase